MSDTRSIDDMEIIAWIPYWDQENAFDSFKRNHDVFDYISVFWHRLDEEGGITIFDAVFEDPEIIRFAREKGIPVIATLVNLPDYDEGGDWDRDRVDMVIGSESSRAKHIQEIIDLIESQGFDGVNIDYEALSREQRQNYTLFIQDLSKAMREKNKILGVSLHAKTGEYISSEDNGSHAQDWKAIQPFVDHMYIMAYDEHYEGGSPGPVASFPWVEEILQFAEQEGILGDKMFLGIPLYGYEWIGSEEGHDGRGLEHREVKEIISDNQLQAVFDRSAKENHLSFRLNGAEHEIWYQNSKSVEPKIDLAGNYNVGGLAFWRLGQEDGEVWSMIRHKRSIE